MTRQQLAGGFCIFLGIILVLQGMGVLPIPARDILHNGLQPWVALAAGGIFLFAGLSIVLKEKENLAPITRLFGMLSITCLLSVFIWHVFGKGGRTCTISMSYLPWWQVWDGGVSVRNLLCRAGLLPGVLMFGAMVWWGVQELLKKR